MSSTTPNLNLFKWDPTADKKSTFNIDTCMNDNWDKLDTAVSNISIESKTYAELKTLKDNNQLKQGKKYLLTDYRTKYQQPTTNVIKEMAIEQLVLTANSTNSFEPIVSSPTYPQDIITYNFNDNKCEDTTTPRTGFIQRRIDTIAKNNWPQDWRKMLWARYKPDTTQYYKDGVLNPIREWGGTANALLDTVYKSGNSLYMAKNTNVPSSMEDGTVFYKVYDDINVGMLIEEKTKIADKVELKKGELHERLTFGDSCYKNYIGEVTGGVHNNVLGSSCTSINLGLTNYDNTLGNSCNANYFGDNSYKNIIMNNCTGNTFNAYCSRNIIGNNCFDNSFGANSDKNILGYSCSDNSFGNNCDENILTTSCNNNSFGNKCSANTLASNCTSNSFGNECSNNRFGNNCTTNSFGNGCSNNSFGNSSARNEFKNYVSSNTFGDGCQTNTIGNFIVNNTFIDGLIKVECKDYAINNKALTNLPIYNSRYSITIQSKDASGSNSVYWYLDSTNKPVYTSIP